MARPKQVELFPGIRPPDDEEEFEEFWARYPRKRSKEQARKAWRQTKKARPPLARLVQALELAKRGWADRDPEFVPYPASWLRAHGWEDEPDPEPQQLSYDQQRARMEQKRRW